MKSYVEEVTPRSIVVSIPVAIKSKDFEFSEAKRQQIRNELGVKNTSKIIGYVGRLAYEKNVGTLFVLVCRCTQKRSISNSSIGWRRRSGDGT